MTPNNLKGELDVSRALTNDVVVKQNLRQEIVVTTVDKLKICLMEHERDLSSGREWIGAAGLTLSLVATLVAAKFDNVGLPADTWRAVYVIAAILSGIWTLSLIIKAIAAASRGGREGLIRRIVNRPIAAEDLYVSEMLRSFGDVTLSGVEGRITPKPPNER